MEINRIEQTFRRLKACGREPNRLFSGNPTESGILFPSDLLESAYLRALKERHYQPDPKGSPAAREAIADYYRKEGAEVLPQNIILTSGTSESFFYLFSLLARPGENILTPSPSYPLFDPIGRLTHTEMRHYPLVEEKDWSIDLGQIDKLCDTRTRAILLISPNNPTGAVHSAEEIGQVVEFANRKRIAIIADEVFSEFIFGDRFPRVMQAARPDLCFTLNGISKMLALPSLKLSWIAVTGEKEKVEEAVDSLETTADTFLSVSTPIQEALPELMAEGLPFIGSYKKEVLRRRDLAVRILSQSDEVRFIPPRGGFYLMGEIARPVSLSEEEFVIRLMEEKGVFVHPGYFYDYEKGTHFVVSHLTDEGRLKEGLDALIDFAVSVSGRSAG